MNYQEADELAAEKGRNVPFEMSQRQANAEAAGQSPCTC